jgi:hypothetical protein
MIFAAFYALIVALIDDQTLINKIVNIPGAAAAGPAAGEPDGAVRGSADRLTTMHPGHRVHPVRQKGV